MNLIIDDLHIDDLYDTGSMTDPQDPALTITVAGKSYTTERQVDARTQAHFPNKYSFPLTMDYYDNPASLVSNII
jgi:hypothetical protein